MVPAPPWSPHALAGEPPFGPYRLLRRLGEGGQGHVYLAEDTRPRPRARRVALKILPRGRSSSRRLVQRFQREAKTMARLEHPSVAEIYESGECEGTPYLAMRFVAGETLADRMKRQSASGPKGTSAASKRRPRLPGRGDIFELVEIFEATARALQAAHDLGLVHRDLKPSNLMIDPDGVPVILDFGIAADLEASSTSQIPRSQFLGTLAYMSPEQIRPRGRTVDARADVYALGVSLFECLTWQRPFDSRSSRELIQQILDDDPPNPRRLNPGVPDDLKHVVLKSIEKDPRHRYATALEFADDLARVLCRDPIAARPVSAIRRARRWTMQLPSAAVVLSTFLIVLAAGAGIAAWLSHFTHADATTFLPPSLAADGSPSREGNRGTDSSPGRSPASSPGRNPAPAPGRRP